MLARIAAKGSGKNFDRKVKGLASLTHLRIWISAADLHREVRLAGRADVTFRMWIRSLKDAWNELLLVRMASYT